MACNEHIANFARIGSSRVVHRAKPERVVILDHRVNVATMT